MSSPVNHPLAFDPPSNSMPNDLGDCPMCHEPMMHLNGTAPKPMSEYPITMSCNLHIVGERCGSIWLMNGDLCPLCEADKAKVLAKKEAIEVEKIEKTRMEEEGVERVAAEATSSKTHEFKTAGPSLEASNNHQSDTKGRSLQSTQRRKFGLSSIFEAPQKALVNVIILLHLGYDMNVLSITTMNATTKRVFNITVPSPISDERN
ncbi:hypothetical protein E6O75_ATG03932 [Venturia nashicola]|uniref:Uncharacterized protein n=1 Tax=Venturia nashicola TaxID=86259 RepID=A0A4Z1PEX4_9PEZI|nr:hypothetical protein E6O75_ATG03932 [Venturia nashicola]